MINATLGILVWVYPPTWGGKPYPSKAAPPPTSCRGGRGGCEHTRGSRGLLRGGVRAGGGIRGVGGCSSYEGCDQSVKPCQNWRVSNFRRASQGYDSRELVTQLEWSLGILVWRLCELWEYEILVKRGVGPPLPTAKHNPPHSGGAHQVSKSNLLSFNLIFFVRTVGGSHLL